MYAVIATGGKQYKVEEGDSFRFEKIPGDVGARVSFDDVLMTANGEDVRIGQPLLEDVVVRGHIIEQDRAKKIIVFKYKRRKRYRRKQGHRQYYTLVKIDRISLKGNEPEEENIIRQKEVATPDDSYQAQSSDAVSGDMSEIKTQAEAEKVESVSEIKEKGSE